jgi:hypothetical protein
MTGQMRGGSVLLAMLAGLGMSGEAEAQRILGRPAPGVFVPGTGFARPGLRLGYNPAVTVLAGSRLDPAFATAADVLAATPRDALTTYTFRQQRYQLYIPLTYQHNRAHPLIVFLSASSNPDDFTTFDALCRAYGIVFACPYGAGDDSAPGRRIRIALDTLEDVRQRLNVDTDRIYLAGFAGGARLVSDIAFSYPEFVGGVMALGGGGGLRNEPWLRDRVLERLSVALAVGELSPARPEVERWRLPPLRDSKVRTKLWRTPRQGQALPPVTQLEEMFLWLEQARGQRHSLGNTYPLARIPEGTVPALDTWATGVVLEARKRLGRRPTRESGLMQLDGVAQRWKDTPAARHAEKLLRRHPDWEKVYARRQMEFAYHEAKAVDAYLEVLNDPMRLPVLLQLSLSRWEEVDRQGPDGKEGREARKRIEQLRRLLPGR